jgi:hypothetical protein
MNRIKDSRLGSSPDMRRNMDLLRHRSYAINDDCRADKGHRYRHDSFPQLSQHCSTRVQAPVGVRAWAHPAAS